MTDTSQSEPLYPSRSSAGADLGTQLNQRTMPPSLVLGVTPSGVEVAASAAKAMGASFDVIVAAHIRLDELGIVGAIAEDADSVLDVDFHPRFGMLDALEEAMEKTRRAIKTERLLFRGQRPLRSPEGVNVIVIDGHTTSPWKLVAAAEAVKSLSPARVLVGTPVATQAAYDRLRARRFETVCPALVSDPGGHPRPFGDPQDPSAERLRSIVVAREAA